MQIGQAQIRVAKSLPADRVQPLELTPLSQLSPTRRPGSKLAAANRRSIDRCGTLT